MVRIILSLLFLVSLSTNGWCVTQWNKAIPAAGDSKSSWPGQVTAQWSILDTLLSNYRQGENLTYKNTTTITVTLGQVVVSNAGASLRLFLNDPGNTDITSSNLDTGSSFSNNTTYYVYSATSSTTASSSTYYISLSSSAPTGPTYYFQLGSFTTNSSGQISSVINNNYIGGFGAWTSKSAEVVYQATTDGFLVANSNVGSDESLVIYTDSNNPPTTVRVRNGGNSSSQLASGTCPIRKGDYYEVHMGSGTLSSAYFLSSGT